MGSKFNSELHNREGVTYLKLSGVVDEDNDLAGLESKLGSGTLVIDLSEVDRINSCGVRDWVNWLGRVEKNGARTVFVDCAPAIVSQINLVHNFTGNGVVKSFYAPYFCTRCQREKLLMLQTRDLVAGGPPFTAPTCRCDECDGPMEFDDMEESYFAFLSNAKKVPSDPSVDAVMQEFSGVHESTGSGSGGKLRSRSSTGSPAPSSSSLSPSPQAAAPVGQVAALPSVPVVPAASRPQSGAQKAVNGHHGSLLPGLAGLKSNTTTPGTPVALAQQAAEQAQSQRFSLGQAPRSLLPWMMLGVLLVLAAVLLIWVFVSA